MNVIDLSNTGRCYGLKMLPPQMQCVGTLPPIVTILESGVFGRRLGLHEAMRAGLWEESWESWLPLCSHHVKIQREVSHLQPRKAFTRYRTCQHLDLGLPSL